jgi:uncharacterized OB-fold protein
MTMADDENTDSRLKPAREENGIVLMPDQWKVDFWASCGELSRFYTELKENARFMGTKCPACGSIYFWPRSWCHECYMDCEWVEVSTKGKLTMFCRVDISLSDLRRDVPFYQGGVHLDGVRYPIAAILDAPSYDDFFVGMPVRAKFLPPEERRGTPRDFHFVPDR